jgi:hypothetical protein
MNLGAPKRLNPLLWDLSNPQERRVLMNNAAMEELENSDASSGATASETETGRTSSALPQSSEQQRILDYIKYIQPSNPSANQSVQDQTLQDNNPANQSSTTGTVQPSDQQALNQVTTQFQQRFSDTAQNKTAFHDIMQKTFGNQYDQSKAETIRQQTLKGDFSWMPKIQLVNGEQLQDQSGTQKNGTALGAYSQNNDTVYLSKDLLRTDMAHAEKILTEEVGHAIDTRVNVKDAQGDEGDIFARQVHGETISAEELTVLKQENDSGVIEIDGKQVEVEYGLVSKIKKKLKKVGRKIKKRVKKIGRGIKKGVKSIGRSIKKGIKKLGSAIKKGFKKFVQSKFIRSIMAIAQFIPIPAVAMIARGYNMAVSAYNVYQGVKNKSWGMVLGGAAGVAGGVAKLGKAFGVSAGFVDKAATFAKHMGNASMAYKAIAEKDFLAATNLAANYFGGDHKVVSSLQQAGKAHQVYNAVKSGDYLGAIGVGSTLMQDFTGASGDKVLQTIGKNAELVRQIDRAVTNGDYSGAVSILNDQFGTDLNLSKEAQDKICQVTQTLQQVHQANQLINNHNYADAAQLLLKTAEQNTTSPESKQRLLEASQKVQQFDNVVTAIKAGHYAEGLATAGDLMNSPVDEQSRKVLTDLQSYAEQAQTLGELVKTGAPDEIINKLKRRMNEQAVIYNLIDKAA